MPKVALLAERRAYLGGHAEVLDENGTPVELDYERRRVHQSRYDQGT